MAKSLVDVIWGRVNTRHLLMIAALFVEPDGVYTGLDHVDPWDESRDARGYSGPFAVVAHPPCKRWGRYWSGGPSAKVRRKLGDDGGCFASALGSVRRWGGVLEHPEASHAWIKHGLIKPPRDGGWIAAGDWTGWTCCVEQGHYGHRARKATWLYCAGVNELPLLSWGKAEGKQRLDNGYHTRAERSAGNGFERISKARSQIAKATPIQFRDLLIKIAENAKMNKGK